MALSKPQKLKSTSAKPPDAKVFSLNSLGLDAELDALDDDEDSLMMGDGLDDPFFNDDLKGPSLSLVKQ